MQRLASLIWKLLLAWLLSVHERFDGKIHHPLCAMCWEGENITSGFEFQWAGSVTQNQETHARRVFLVGLHIKQRLRIRSSYFDDSSQLGFGCAASKLQMPESTISCDRQQPF